LKPVVATNVGGFSEFINDGASGLLVQSIEPQAFAKGVIQWYAEKRNSNYTKAIEDIVNANGFGKINGIIDSILK
jgi:glycosyltransferase involved in cell wall biosynthesis